VWNAGTFVNRTVSGYKVKRYGFLVVLCVLAAAATLNAAPITYENTTGSALSAVGWNGSQWVRQGQTFTLTDEAYIITAEFDFVLTSTEIYTCSLVESDLLTVVAQTTGFIASPSLSGWERFVFSSSPLVPAGDYAITIQASETSPGDIDAIYRAGSGNPYPDGNQVYSVAGGPWLDATDNDCLFRFTFDPIPEPGTMALVLLGSGVLALTRRSGRRKA
jgi:hypothetical protein